MWEFVHCLLLENISNPIITVLSPPNNDKILPIIYIFFKKYVQMHLEYFIEYRDTNTLQSSTAPKPYRSLLNKQWNGKELS